MLAKNVTVWVLLVLLRLGGVWAAAPTRVPTRLPTRPTTKPTPGPTVVKGKPTALPTRKPTLFPTARPTKLPTSRPTSIPTSHPTSRPTSHPTGQPTARPSIHKAPKMTMSRPLDGQLAAGVIIAIGIAIGLLFGCFWSMRGKAKRDTRYTQTEEEGFFEDGL